VITSVGWGARKQREKILWLKIFTFSSKTFPPFRLIDTAPSTVGFTKLQTKHIGANWSTVSFTLPHHSQTAPTIGDPSHPGKHGVP
jgi:hypothetical protein